VIPFGGTQQQVGIPGGHQLVYDWPIGDFRPVICSSILVGWGFQMSSLDDHLVAVTDTRLAIVSDTAANLIAQLSELNELRERVRKAELSARRSQRVDRKRTREKRPPQLAEHSSISM
jgi:hypothetical protein